MIRYKGSEAWLDGRQLIITSNYIVHISVMKPYPTYRLLLRCPRIVLHRVSPCLIKNIALTTSNIETTKHHNGVRRSQVHGIKYCTHTIRQNDYRYNNQRGERTWCREQTSQLFTLKPWASNFLNVPWWLYPYMKTSNVFPFLYLALPSPQKHENATPYRGTQYTKHHNTAIILNFSIIFHKTIAYTISLRHA